MSASMILPTPNLPKQEKAAKPKRFGLPKVGPKMRARLVEYRIAKSNWWAARVEIDGGRCQFTTEDGIARCYRTACCQPHHICGRGKYLSVPGTYLEHHSWISDNGKEAEARGYLVRDRSLGIKEAAI